MSLELDKKEQFKHDFKKRCYLFSISILKLSEKLRSNSLNWPLIDQLVRSGTSIGANVVEGGNSVSKKEFINYFQIALKSSSETLYWLSLLKEINPDFIKELELLLKECLELKKLLSTIILNTRNSS
ncbi:four helix bundle protein [Candidatus Roizmanbacteria bacterium CG07_land_8_20_14_0_80_34_15]|uniref:Four helix bundle protein n=1 Tax=Candidatus Roizmanbacteria bacterium CG07_land_8_20_14_0_80_34_15 TaxID=1974849 RepID=A0A2M6YVN0_9BACT|nr:MAG: four helix bundle protein [Candidatus Roizmanbacteria bacterium CG07_land_8_20_14_0_80_34_15]